MFSNVQQYLLHTYRFNLMSHIVIPFMHACSRHICRRASHFILELVIHSNSYIKCCRGRRPDIVKGGTSVNVGYRENISRHFEHQLSSLLQVEMAVAEILSLLASSSVVYSKVEYSFVRPSCYVVRYVVYASFSWSSLSLISLVRDIVARTSCLLFSSFECIMITNQLLELSHNIGWYLAPE